MLLMLATPEKCCQHRQRARAFYTFGGAEDSGDRLTRYRYLQSAQPSARPCHPRLHRKYRGLDARAQVEPEQDVAHVRHHGVVADVITEQQLRAGA